MRTRSVGAAPDAPQVERMRIELGKRRPSYYGGAEESARRNFRRKKLKNAIRAVNAARRLRRITRELEKAGGAEPLCSEPSFNCTAPAMSPDVPPRMLSPLESDVNCEISENSEPQSPMSPLSPYASADREVIGAAPSASSQPAVWEPAVWAPAMCAETTAVQHGACCFSHEGGEGSRGKENQDTWFTARPSPDVSLYAVFDGHGKVLPLLFLDSFL